jgi:hypothetical protein
VGSQKKVRITVCKAEWTMNTSKRKQSRSPEGENDQRKIPRDGFTSYGRGDRQRTSSINTNMVNATMDPRQRERVGKGSASIRSPASTDGSTYQDAPSSRSTPQPHPPRQMAAMTVAPNDTNEDVDAFKRQISASLTAFAFHVAGNASLRSSYDQAKRQLQSTTSVYENMKGHFQKYPAIEERTTSDKNQAVQKVAKLDLQLKASLVSQSKLATSVSEHIFNMFSRAEAAAPHSDRVSTEKHDAFQLRFQKQQDLLDQAQEDIEKQKSQIERLEEMVKEACGAAKQAQTQAITTNRTFTEEIAPLKARMYKIESSAESEQLSIRNLSATVTRNTNDIEKDRSAVADMKLDLSAKENTSSSASRTTDSAASSINSLREILGKVEHSMASLIPVKNEVSQIWAEITEPGKEAVLKRLKKHDQNINNLWTKIEAVGAATDPARLKQLEGSVETLTKDLRDVRDNVSQYHKTCGDAHGANVPTFTVASAAVPQGFDPDASREKLQEVMENLETSQQMYVELAEGHDRHTESIEEHDKRLDTLLKMIEKSNHDNMEGNQQLRALDRLGNNRHEVTSTKCASIEKKVDTSINQTRTLQSSVESLSEEIKSLQKRPFTSAAPPPTSGQEAAQFRPLQSPSFSASSSRTNTAPGTAQTNSFHAANIEGLPQAHNLTNSSSPGLRNGMPVVTVDQIEGIWGSIRGLKQRFDNLTTEEVVKGMVDQTTKMYPAARDFQTAVNTLIVADRAITERLAVSESRLIALQRELKNYVTVTTATQQHDGLSKSFNQVLQQSSEKMRNEVRADIRTEVDNISNKVRADNRLEVNKISNEIRAEIRTEVARIRKEVNSAIAAHSDEILKAKETVEGFIDVFEKGGE